MVPHAYRIALMIAPDATFTRGALRGVRNFARERADWSLYHGPFRRGYPAAAALVDWHGHGVIARPETPADAELLRGLGIPTVIIGDGCRVEGAPVVRVDDTAVGQLAAQHFVERRFRNAAFCGQPNSPTAQRRRVAFVAAAEAAGMACHVFAPRKSQRISAHLHQEEVEAWVRSLPRPVGVLGDWDGHAAQVLEACSAAGISVPDEAAVLGVDNDDLVCDLAELPLSSVITDANGVGYRAAACLAALFTGGEPVPDSILVPPLGIAVRQSTNVMAVEDRLVQEAVGIIWAEACRELTVAKLCKQLAISRRSLEMRFRRVLGSSPHEIMCQTRHNRVKELLATTELLVGEIARLAGFPSASALIVSFQSAFQTTPGAWRRASRKA